MELVKDIVQHPLFGITSLALSVLGILLAVVFYRRSRRDKKPLWSIKNNNLIRGFSKQLPNLDVKYSGQNVETLSVCKIAFWNAGLETIRGEDIAEADRIAILPLNETKLLDVKLLDENSKPSRFLISTEPDMTAAFLTFDFVDKNQGAVIQVIHTGASVKDVCLKGTIKGAGAPEDNSLEESSTAITALQIGIVMSAFVILFLVGSVLAISFGLGIWGVPISLFCAMPATFFIMIRVGSWNLYRIPKHLRSHFG